jgi:hypothetical protein
MGWSFTTHQLAVTTNKEKESSATMQSSSPFNLENKVKGNPSPSKCLCLPHLGKKWDGPCRLISTGLKPHCQP